MTVTSFLGCFLCGDSSGNLMLQHRVLARWLLPPSAGPHWSKHFLLAPMRMEDRESWLIMKDLCAKWRQLRSPEPPSRSSYSELLYLQGEKTITLCSGDVMCVCPVVKMANTEDHTAGCLGELRLQRVFWLAMLLVQIWQGQVRSHLVQHASDRREDRGRVEERVAREQPSLAVLVGRQRLAERVFQLRQYDCPPVCIHTPAFALKNLQLLGGVVLLARELAFDTDGKIQVRRRNLTQQPNHVVASAASCPG